MPALRLEILAYVSLCTFLLYGVGRYFLDRPLQRYFFSLAVICLYIWCGIGAAYEFVPIQYLWSYLGFTACFVLAFALTLRGTHRLEHALYSHTQRNIAAVTRKPFFIVAAISLYLVGHLVPLVYPEFRLDSLLSPPVPDLRAAYASRFCLDTEGANVQLARYITVLLHAPFLVAACRLVNRPLLLAMVLAAPAYLLYCTNAYIGRGQVLTLVLMYFLTLWIRKPRWRRCIVALGLLSAPIMSIGLYEYGLVRLGADRTGIAPFEALARLGDQETGFPLDAEAIIRSGERVNVVEYFTWITTLPIPKALTGSLSDARINYEMSRILLNQEVDSPGGYVRLTGVVTESIYVYGETFFWLHAVLIGFLSAFTCRLVERHAALLMAGISMALILSYDLSRGGIMAALPPLVNGHLLFLAGLGYVCWRRIGAHSAVLRPGGIAVMDGLSLPLIRFAHPEPGSTTQQEVGDG